MRPKISKGLLPNVLTVYTLAIEAKKLTNAIKYVPKLEIDRSNFQHLHQLGTGNFGCVYKGRTIFAMHYHE